MRRLRLGDGDLDIARAALCRFAAENLLGEVAALKQRVISGAGSLAAAAKALVAE